MDPCFKEQFEIAHVNPRYALVLAEVPSIFIGSEEQIIGVVEIMSKEINRAFQQAGATLPPWRHTASMLSKWRPRKSEDLSVDGQTLDSRAPSLPQQLSPAVLRNQLAIGQHLMRHSTCNAFPTRRASAVARVSLDERKCRITVDEVSRKKTSEAPNAAAPLSRCSLQPVGVVATVQQSMSALSRKASFNSSNHAVHLV